MYFLNGFLVFCLLAFFPLDGFAKMYKWIDKDGQVHFTDRKPTEETKEIKEYGKDGTREPEPVKALDLKILDIKTKFLERRGKYIVLSLRVKVKCTDPKFRGDAEVRLRAIDRKGFELYTKSVEGKIVSRGPAILSDKVWMKYKFYKQIDKWEVMSVHFD